MKFAFCVEDETDEAVFALILEKLLGVPVEPDRTTYQFARGGWSTALLLAPSVAKRAATAYLDGAVFAIDNDGSSEHESAHSNDERCRFCLLRQAANVQVPLAWTRAGAPPLRYLFAVPVQTVETWLLLVKEYPFPGLPEGIGIGHVGRRKLKRLLYGDEDPGRALMREIAIPLVTRMDPQDLAQKSKSFKQFLNQI